jgi:ankyrin repeat protein
VLQESCTALISATEDGHIGVVEALIRAGADLNLQDKVSILYVCCMCKHSAARDNCVYPCHGRSSRLHSELLLLACIFELFLCSWV